MPAAAHSRKLGLAAEHTPEAAAPAGQAPERHTPAIHAQIFRLARA